MYNGTLLIGTSLGLVQIRETNTYSLIAPQFQTPVKGAVTDI